MNINLVKRLLTEDKFKVGDVVIPKRGPHAGHPHEVFFVHPHGSINIKPKGLKASQIKYRLGAATVKPTEVVKGEK